MRLRANAKINLYLRVEPGRRPDGFHSIESLFHSVSLADELEVEPDDDLRLTVAARDYGDIPRGDDNLVLRAADVLRARTGVGNGASIRLVKWIPTGAGLGGGSADAAAVLIALSELWKLELSRAELARLGLEIGSDVPFCLMGGSAIGRGRGERLEPVDAPTVFWFVLGISEIPLSTAEVYERFDAPDDREFMLRDPVEALEAGRPQDLGAALFNDLARVAQELRPELTEAIERMLAAGALGATVSGSGPTIFGVAASETHARDIARVVQGAFDRVEVVASRPQGVEPGA